jgi:hypothetical protein
METAMSDPTQERLKNRSDDAGDDVTDYRDRPSDDGKIGDKANRSDAPAAQNSLGNFAGEDLKGDRQRVLTSDLCLPYLWFVRPSVAGMGVLLAAGTLMMTSPSLRSPRLL